MRSLWMSCLLVMGVSLVSDAAAQATRLPQLQRAIPRISRSEIGLVLSFPNGGGTAFEGAYRVSHGKFDLGFRGGIFTPGSNADSRLLVGAEARERVVTHTEDFPLDGALIVGVGGQFSSGSSFAVIPVGLSLAGASIPETRRISIVPYVQPTGFLVAGMERRTFSFRSGWARFPADARFDARISAGLGDLEVCQLAPCGCIRLTQIDLAERFPTVGPAQDVSGEINCHDVEDIDEAHARKLAAAAFTVAPLAAPAVGNCRTGAVPRADRDHDQRRSRHANSDLNKGTAFVHAAHRTREHHSHRGIASWKPKGAPDSFTSVGGQAAFRVIGGASFPSPSVCRWARRTPGGER